MLNPERQQAEPKSVSPADSGGSVCLLHASTCITVVSI